MKKHFYIFSLLFLLCFCYKTKSQINLVQNPSFEDTLHCPTFASQIKYAIGWDTLIAGGGGTPDFYNRCNTNIVGVPSNFASFQYPHSGDGYSGIISYYKTTPTSREYVQNKLLHKLIINKQYCVKAYVNLANKSTVAIDQFCIYLDNGSIYTNFYDVAINFSPQVCSQNNYYLTDTLNWIKIEGVYTANGAEEYLTIGNFKSNNLTNTITVSSGILEYCYYNIDDVSVIDTETKAYAGDDKLICLGDSVFIGRTPEVGLECQWSYNNTQIADGAGIWVKPNATQQYIVKQDNCGIISYDTVQVSVKDEDICNPKTDNTITIPNTFTPNNDGVNDTWQFELPSSVTLNSVELYNRWGNLIHQTTNSLSPKIILWSGRTTSGEPCSEGVYFYVLKYTDAKGEEQNLKGYISLFR